MTSIVDIAATLPPDRLRAVARAMVAKSVRDHDAGDQAAGAFWHALGHALLDVADLDRLPGWFSTADDDEGGEIIEDDGGSTVW